MRFELKLSLSFSPLERALERESGFALHSEKSLSEMWGIGGECGGCGDGDTKMSRIFLARSASLGIFSFICTHVVDQDESFGRTRLKLGETETQQ